MKFRTILLFGAPGAGKGTQGKILGTIPNFFHCACGDVFRSLKPDSSVGQIFLDYSSRGQLVPDQPTVDLHVAALESTFPVYPAGAVTLRLPVTLTARDSATAQLSVTYMACSERTCLAPVIDKRIAVRIPVVAASAP